MRCRLSLFALLLVVPLLGSDSPRVENDATEIDDLDGSWRLQSITFNGKNVTEFRWVETYSGGTYTRELGGVETGSYKCNRTRKPFQLDLTPRPSTENVRRFSKHRIYEVDRDTLRMAWGTWPSERPTSFDQKDVVIATFTRVRK
jgi:uncharacterized protein (TIGR03067 family)